ncbi:MAG: PAS domain-containing protein [Bdellovibrionaceae bacterium]|nr:PAS domain-containing protein [Pseudobdellovibrionaceae bacterium]
MDVSLIVLSLNILIFVLGVAIFTRALPFRRRPEFFWLLMVAASLCVISFCSLNVYIQTSFEKMTLFSRMRFLGLAVLPVSWFLFILTAFGSLSRRQLRWIYPVLFGPVALTLAFTLVPGWRDLVIRDFQPIQLHDARLIAFKNGAWFPVHMGTSALWAILSLLYTSYLAWKTSGERRKQLVVLTLGGAVSLGLDLYLVAANSPYRWFMLSSATLAISEIAIFYAIIRYGLLDIARIGKDQVFDKMADPILILDRENRLLDLNQSAQSFFGLTKKDLFRSCSDLRPELDLVGNAVSYEWSCSMPEQVERSFVVTVNPLGADGELSGKIVILREFTEHRMIENNLSNNLELKSKLLSLIAHDFSGFVQAQTVLSSALEKKVQPGLRGNAEALTESVSASKEFMENVMRWAEFQKNDFQPVVRPFEIVTLVREAVRSQNPMLSVKGIDVTMQAAPESIVVEGDSVMLGSAIRNVLNNAVRASRDQGRISISISIQGAQVQIEIQDEGHGMEMSRLSRVNESDDSSAVFSESSPGFGIGLTIAKKFLSLHSGHLQIESRVDSGTKVRLTLPL